MTPFKNLKPLHFYLIAIACFLVSGFFRGKVAALDYAFTAIGFVFFFAAVARYLRK